MYCAQKDRYQAVARLGGAPESGERAPSGEESQRGRVRNSGFTKTPGFSSHNGLVGQTIQNPVDVNGE